MTKKPFVVFKKIKGVEYFKNQKMKKFEPVGLKFWQNYIQVISFEEKTLNFLYESTR